MKVLVCGADGQLGQCLRDELPGGAGIEVLWTDRNELDITDESAVAAFFQAEKPDVCMNGAAYTAVDKAESKSERNLAAAINELAAKTLAENCRTNGTRLLHISTDFVFDGQKSSPYTEDDPTNPLGIYGVTKQGGEWEVAQQCPEALIIRTSWLYSEHGHNFVKTMLRLGKEKSELGVVADQVGNPTYAGDLAGVLWQIVQSDKVEGGIYHYSNEGVCSWYDLAHAVMDLGDLDCHVKPIATADYPTPAKRPPYSVLDKNKIKSAFGLEIPHWRDALKRCLSKI